MKLSSLQLEAFSAVARERHFSRAAESLGLAQSALSTRILNLEDDLGTRLFIRDRAGVSLTDAAQRLLVHCQSIDALERELLVPGSAAIRIGGYSSIVRSLVQPALSKTFGPKKRRNIELSLITRELEELPELFRRGEVDYLFLDRELSGSAWESTLLGEEEYVLVRSAKESDPESWFLDHDERDETTLRFLKLNRMTVSSLRRRYFDDIYGILDGIKQGWGNAIVPRHLLKDETGLQIVSELKPLRVPVYLHYRRLPVYPSHHEAILSLAQLIRLSLSRNQ